MKKLILLALGAIYVAMVLGCGSGEKEDNVPGPMPPKMTDQSNSTVQTPEK